MSDHHTPERLIVAEGNECVIISPDRAPCVAGAYGDDAKAIARRLVACWNACEGISTENLENNLPIKELAERYNAALSERDELLGLIVELLDTELAELACQGSHAPVEDVLGRMEFAVAKLKHQLKTD